MRFWHRAQEIYDCDPDRCSCWYQVGCRNVYQVINNPKHHHSFSLCPSLLKRVPVQVCEHRGHTAGRVVVAHHKSR